MEFVESFNMQNKGFLTDSFSLSSYADGEYSGRAWKAVQRNPTSAGDAPTTPQSKATFKVDDYDLTARIREIIKNKDRVLSEPAFYD